MSPAQRRPSTGLLVCPVRSTRRPRPAQGARRCGLGHSRVAGSKRAMQQAAILPDPFLRGILGNPHHAECRPMGVATWITGQDPSIRGVRSALRWPCRSTTRPRTWIGEGSRLELSRPQGRVSEPVQGHAAGCASSTTRASAASVSRCTRLYDPRAARYRKSARPPASRTPHPWAARARPGLATPCLPAPGRGGGGNAGNAGNAGNGTASRTALHWTTEQIAHVAARCMGRR